jgi:hypothetical protein
MKKCFFVLAIWGLLFAGIQEAAIAQTKGEGVGALATRTSGSTTISVTAGRTSPWSEVIVEDASENLVAVAEIDAGGVFNFTFLTDSSLVGNLYLYSADEVGITNKVQITGTNINNFLLPPTIVGVDDPNLPDTSVSMNGFTYHFAQVTVSVESDQGYFETFTPTVDSVSGEWSLTVGDLSPGSYIATASSSWSDLQSLVSQELFFDIEGIDLLAPVATITNVYKNIKEAIESLPEPIKQTANIVSKVGAPVATSWFLLQLLLTGMGLKDILTYLLIFYFWLMGILARRRRRERWGILYDAVTKNPLARGIVRLYREPGGLLETDVTGTNGAFSFLPPEGNYRLSVRKPGFNFPSKFVLGQRDGEYTPVYHGEIFGITKEKPVVALNIPADPKVYEKEIGSRLKAFFNKYSGFFTWFIFVPGLALSFVAYTTRPNLLNIIVMGFYIFGIVIVVVRGVQNARMWGTAIGEDKQPIAHLSLSLLDTTLGRQLQRRVTDLSGRFQFVVPAGRYTIKITSPGYSVVPKKGFYTGEEILVSKEKEVIKRKIAVKKA